jgi:hypothetical protein
VQQIGSDSLKAVSHPPFFLRQCHYVVQNGLELLILLPRPPEFCDYRPPPPPLKAGLLPSMAFGFASHLYYIVFLCLYMFVYQDSNFACLCFVLPSCLVGRFSGAYLIFQMETMVYLCLDGTTTEEGCQTWRSQTHQCQYGLMGDFSSCLTLSIHMYF